MMMMVVNGVEVRIDKYNNILSRSVEIAHYFHLPVAKLMSSPTVPYHK